MFNLMEKKRHGYVDLGTNAQEDSLPIAREVFALKVVSINDSGKLPRYLSRVSKFR